MNKSNQLIAGLACFMSCQVFAATDVTYTATGDPNTSPDGVTGGGTPVDVWTATLPGGPSSTGSFFDGTNTAWAIYSTPTSTGTGLANHIFTGGSLAVNQEVSIDFANEFIASGNQAGVNLKSGSTTVFSLFFEGGGIGNYQYTDSVTTGGDTGVGYAFTNYADLTFTLNSATDYTFSFGTSGNISGTVDNLPIDGVEIFNNAQENTGSVFFRDLSVSSIPEPQTYALLFGFIACVCITVRRRVKLSN